MRVLLPVIFILLVTVVTACGEKKLSHQTAVRDARQMSVAIGGPLVEMHHLRGDVWQIAVREVRLRGGLSCWTLHALDRGYRMIDRVQCV